MALKQLNILAPNYGTHFHYSFVFLVLLQYLDPVSKPFSYTLMYSEILTINPLQGQMKKPPLIDKQTSGWLLFLVRFV